MARQRVSGLAHYELLRVKTRHARRLHLEERVLYFRTARWKDWKFYVVAFAVEVVSVGSSRSVVAFFIATK